MNVKQKLELRRSEIRSRLNEIAGLAGDAVTAEVRAEGDALVNEYQNVELQYRAALVAENDDTGGDDDAQAGELRQLKRELRASAFIQSALGHRALTGAEAEYAQEHNLDGNHLPLEALAPVEVESRADVVTPVPSTTAVTQGDVLGRIFAGSDAEYLGVKFKSVPNGEHVVHVMTAGNAPAIKAKASLHEATAGAFTAVEFSPKSFRARYLFNIEDRAIFARLDSELRRDMSMAVADAMDEQIVAGNGTAPNWTGFLYGANENQGNVQTSNKLVNADAVEIWADGVDGKHAKTPREVRVLMTPRLYTDGAVKILDKAVNMWHMAEEVGASIRVSSRIPYSATATGNSANAGAGAKLAWVVRRKGYRPSEAVLVTWSAAEIIEDRYTEAAKGQVAITLNLMSDFKIVRNDTYDRVKVKLDT